MKSKLHRLSMAMRHSGRIVALAGVLTAFGLATDASAQPAQGSAAAVISSIPFQQYVFRDPCPLGTVCTLDFATVPAGSQLKITNVSCYVKFDVSSMFATVDFLTLNIAGTDIIITLVPTFISQANNHVVYSANHVVSASANAGQYFQTKFGLTNAVLVPIFACHISGDMQKLGPAVN